MLLWIHHLLHIVLKLPHRIVKDGTWFLVLPKRFSRDKRKCSNSPWFWFGEQCKVIHSVHLPFLLGNWTSYQIFKKGGGLDRTSTFRDGLLGKRAWLFWGEGGCNFFIKNKLKSELFPPPPPPPPSNFFIKNKLKSELFQLFNDKKFIKFFFSVITNSSNWEL